MKFGKNILVEQAKHPLRRYIDYKDLKKTIKSRDDTDLFNQQLQNEIEIVNTCFSQYIVEIQNELFSVVSDTSSTAARLREIMRISEQVESLRRFAVWNAVAVVKILKKRTKLLAGPVPPGLTTPQPPAPSLALPALQPEEWLSRQNFFSGSDFAELQASLESIAEKLSADRLMELGSTGRLGPELAHPASDESERCPICLERCVDAVELSSCGHRFCWKCVVMGPIAFAPGEYRLSRCSVCRREQPLDPTRNFKTVCSNQLERISELLSEDDSSLSPQAWMGLDTLYGTASGGLKQVSEKERQAMDTLDSGHHATSFFCSLCCEPLLLEAVSTTPCKHHFHRVCLQKYAEPSCPLCSEGLPIELVTPRYTQWSAPSPMASSPSYMHFGFMGYFPVAPQEPTYMSRLGPIKAFSRELIEKKKSLATQFQL